MKKMSRKNFRGAPLFSSKSSTSTASHGSSSSSPGLGPSAVRRATWADKIRDKLPPLGENEYEVLWERGVLGVIFLESEKDGIPYVSKATESCISPIVSPGDILKFVNVVRSKDHSFSDFFKILATMKKPVLLRFERQSASTPSSDEDDGSQLFGGPRGSSANNTGSNSRQDAARQDGLRGDEGGPIGGLTKSHSVLQKDQKPPKPTRGAFWRTVGTKESVDRDHAAQAVGPHAMNGENERMAALQGQQRVPGNRDHQVSPRDTASANASVDPSLHSPLGQQEYQVYWETGLLGLFFGENRSTNLPVVTRSTSSANLVVRRAVAVHDTLVSANGIKSADYTFEAFFGRLQQMNKPVRLVFRRRQTADPAVVIKQGDQQQHEHQQQQHEHQQQQHEQLQQQLQHRQEQMHEQNQKRELYEARDLHERQQEQEQREQREQKQREQQIREQKQREQYIREQKQREQHIREQKQREQKIHELKQREQQILGQKQRELEIHEQKQREQQIREEKQRELQMLGQKHREQQALEQKQRELQILEQKQREQQIQEQRQREEQALEQQQREQQVLEQKQQEQQILEKNQREQQIIGQNQVEDQVRKEQQREQELREEQRCQQPTGSHDRTLSITVDAPSLPPTSPADERIPCHNRTPIPNAKHASTPPPLPPSAQVRLEASTHHEYRRGASGQEITSPPSSLATLKGSESARQRERPKWILSTDYQTSPKANGSLPVRSLARSDSLLSALPIIYNSPKVSSSPLVSPVFPSVGSEIKNEMTNLASSCDAEVPDRAAVTPVSAAKEKEAVQSPKGIALTNVHDKQDCDKTEDQWSQKSPAVTNEEEPVLFVDNDTVSLSPTETWDLPEHMPLPEILTLESAEVDSGVDVGVLLSPNAEIDFEDVVMAETEFVEETELVDEAEVAQEAELIDEGEPANAEVAYKTGLARGVKLASETEPLISSLPANDLAEDSSNPDVEVGMLAGVEMGIAVEDIESEVLESIEAGSDQNTSPWDLEPESDGQKAYHYSSNTTSSRDGPMSSSSGCIPVDNEMDSPKGDFEDVSDPSDEFSHDPDISGDIDTVEGDVIMQESSKSKVDAANVPKQTKSSMNANLAKYKKKGKSTRGVTKLPALHEDDAVTVPLVAPNAVNTTIQVRGRPKPKLTMADTPDSTTFLIKWKENRSIGLQLKEVRLAKGTYPLVTDVCQKPCCELLRHICVGDVIIEINGRNTSTMGVKKTVNFLKSCSKTTLMKIRHGPAYVNQRMSAAV
uniref:PDZ domain-containing protein n=1 Tax=Hyaloperonospora arabidopsidis (strain Emoy2) TaxID=559515 RepID=M4BI38_HYAAE